MTHQSITLDSNSRPVVEGLAEQLGMAILVFVLSSAAFCALMLTVNIDIPLQISALLGFMAAVFFAPDKRIYLAVQLLMVLLLSVFLASILFDVSWDGTAYHQEAIMALPKSFSLISNGGFEGIHSALIENYPKLSWLFGASMVSVFGSVHAAKNFNVLLIFAVFLLSFSTLLDVKNRATRILFSLALALNPIALSQVFTHYVDGALACFLAVAILGFRAYQKKVTCPQHAVCMIFGGFLGAAALKFTGFVFMAVGFVAFCLMFFTRRYKSGHEQPFISVVQLGLLAGLGVTLLFNPYGTHLIQGRHIFYPAMGVGKYQELISGQTQKDFYALSPAKKLMVSVFSESTNLLPQSKPESIRYKIPFAVHARELQSFKDVDVRVGGWGPFFGGLFVFALIFVVANARRVKGAYFILLLLMVLSGINPESWWARFNPQLCLLVVFMLLAISGVSSMGMKMAQIGLVMLIVNAGLVFLPMARRFQVDNAKTTEVVLNAAKSKSIIYWAPKKHHLEPVFSRLGIDYTEVQRMPESQRLECSGLLFTEQICISR